MKISLSWLNEYVNVQEFFKTPDELARLLTGAGLEVDAVQDGSKQFNHVVVGQVVELVQHPKADKLTLCQVDAGEGKPRQIICGAKNHKQGDKVVVALPGAVLPGDFAIKVSKIRDVESQGMLCSESELGLKDESEGIVILPADAKVGLSFAEYSGLTDILYEINVTPNRADCLSHVGLAREISCLLNRSLRLPEGAQVSGQSTNAKSIGASGDAKPAASSRKTADHVKVELKNSEMCPRYAGRSIFGVKVGPSPDWLKRRVQSVGMNSINNVVDVTNFVMMEYGQPLHSFDAKEIRGAKIIIEKSKAGEKFTTLDGTELTFTGDELTIRDGERTVALAGVIGGKNSGVSDATTEIFLESAHFSPKAVRRASRRHGIDTDSSQRYSRGTDPEVVIAAMNRAVALIQAVAGGEAAKDHVDLYPTPVVRSPITVRKSMLEDRLGYKVEIGDFLSWLKRLHCTALPNSTQETVHVAVPAFRFDLDQEMDLVEEYARLNGYDKIPEHFPPLAQWPVDSAAAFVNENRVAELLRAEGFFEARNYNFVSAKWQSSLFTAAQLPALGLGLEGEAVNVRNPLSEETGQMRQSLLPGLLTNMLHNYSHGLHHGRLFETGYVFSKNTKAEGGSTFKEPHRVALIAWGHDLGLWEKTEQPVIYNVKSAISNMITKLSGQVQFKAFAVPGSAAALAPTAPTAGAIASAGATAPAVAPAGASTASSAGKVLPAALPNFIHPGQVATLFYEGRTIGFMGALHPAFKEEHKLRHDVAVMEIDLAALMRGQPRKPKLSAISKFPAVQRDLALVMPLTLSAGDVQKEIEKAGAPLLQSIAVFDLYTGKGVAEGSKSVAYRMVFQDQEATLSEERLNQVSQTIGQAIEQKFNIRPR